MKKILIFLINCYQKIPFSSHKQCRFTPTCSQYAKEAIRIHGVFRGSILAIKRISRCRPFADYGYDPVPMKENQK